MIKGGDNYPRDIASMLSFLQNYNLHGNHQNHTTINPGLKENAFTQVGNEEPIFFEKRVSATYRAFKKGDCPYTTKHT